MRLNEVMIYVKDLPRMKSFYRDVLGIKPIESESDTYVAFNAGAARFALHTVPDHVAAEIEIIFPPSPRENNPIKLTFQVHDLASERQRLEALGVAIVQRPWGSSDGIDPEGNIFGIQEVDL
jgi:catechol 2,3-dioxygenase-like lactoylglutathione lyase family enzyme